MPHTVLSHRNADGEEMVLSGDANSPRPGLNVEIDSWVQKVHPDRHIWVKDERRHRASYVATRRSLARFLVPHRFEGDKEPLELRRAHLGYGIGLNRQWLGEIMGHIRGTPASRNWGPLLESPAEEGGEIDGRPPGGVARQMWDDATRANKNWPNFFGRKVLEWMLSSLGGFIVVDLPQAQTRSRRDAERQGKRPFFRFAPMSWVEDLGRSSRGFRYVKLRELVDNREPREKEQTSFDKRHVLYELDMDSGVTTISRWDDDGEQIGEDVTQELVDRQGNPTLPLLQTRFGEHELIPWLGSGLLQGLTDIVIDTHNLLSEVREGYRDVSFGVLAYRGPDVSGVESSIEEGSRLLNLGDSEIAELQRIAAESAEVEAGLSLAETSLRSWTLSAKRKAIEAMERAEARSGVSLKSEFQIDLKPLLVEVTEELDGVESDAMFLAGQLAGFRPEQLEEVGVSRGTEFNLEDEASRISRIVDEAAEFLHLVPAAAKAQIVERWLEHNGINDLDQEVEVAGSEEPVALREILPEQIRGLAELDERRLRRQSDFAGSGGGGSFL